MKIGIDIDDTVLDFYPEFAKFCNENYGKNVTPHELALDFYDVLGSKEEALSILRDFVDAGYGHTLKFFEDFKNIFSKLNENFEIVFITSRSYDFRDKTIEYFKKNLGEFDYKIYYARDYDPKRKSFVCKNFDVDFLVDDLHFNAMDCAENGVKVLLLDKPWNQNCSEHENITRVKDWNEIMEILNGY